MDADMDVHGAERAHMEGHHSRSLPEMGGRARDLQGRLRRTISRQRSAPVRLKRAAAELDGDVVAADSAPKSQRRISFEFSVQEVACLKALLQVRPGVMHVLHACSTYY